MIYVWLICFLLTISFYYEGFSFSKSSDFVCLNKSDETERNKKCFLFVFFFVCALLMGLRGVTVGIDTFNYKELYERIADNKFKFIFDENNIKVEKGWLVYNKLFSYISKNYFAFQIFTAIVFCAGMGKFIYDNCDDVIVGSVIFLGIGIYCQTFTIMRQYFSVMLVINAWTLLKKGNIVSPLVLWLVAITFHISAIVFGIAYVMIALRKNIYIYRALPLILCLFILNFDSVFEFVIELVGKYTWYSENENRIEPGFVQIMWIIIGVISLYMFYKNINDDNYNMSESFFTLLFVMFSFLGKIVSYMDRLGYYFVPFALIVLPNMTKEIKNDLIRTVYICGIYICFIAYFVLSGFSTPHLEYIPFFIR